MSALEDLRTERTAVRAALLAYRRRLEPGSEVRDPCRLLALAVIRGAVLEGDRLWVESDDLVPWAVLARVRASDVRRRISRAVA